MKPTYTELITVLENAAEWLNDMGCEHADYDSDCAVCQVNSVLERCEQREDTTRSRNE